MQITYDGYLLRPRNAAVNGHQEDRQREHCRYGQRDLGTDEFFRNHHLRS